MRPHQPWTRTQNQTRRVATLAVAQALLVAAGVALLAATAAAESSVREKRDVPPFTEIQLDGSGTLAVTVGEQASVVVETSPSDLSRVRTEVSGTRLRIFTEWGFDSKLHVDITLPRLTALALSGSTEARVDGSIEGASLSLESAGAATASLEELAVEELRVNLAGSATLEAAGHATKVLLRTAGSAKVEFEQLEIDTAEVSLVGAGTASLHVTSALTGTITGSGVIHLAGAPDTVNVRTLGSGRIIHHKDGAHAQR